MPHIPNGSASKRDWSLNHHLLPNSLLKIAKMFNVQYNKGDDYIFSSQQCHVTERVTRTRTNYLLEIKENHTFIVFVVSF